MNQTIGNTEISSAIDEFSKVLASLNIGATVEDCEIKGPMRRYRVRLSATTRPAKLETLSKNMALSMRAISLPIIRPEYRDGIVIIEFMYAEHPLISFEDMVEKSGLNDERAMEAYQLPVVFGAQNIDEPLIVDLVSLPHLLVAGSTGSGKSIFLHSIINSLISIHNTKQVKLAIVDPKFVEFAKYNKSAPLMYDIINDPSDAIVMLEDLLFEVERRLRTFKKYNCRDAQEYREKIKKIPYIVVVIDELADLMKFDRKLFESKLCELVQKCRAAGIFVIAATQHPSSKVITGDIKANFPAKVAFKVSTNTHSRVILDTNGAEHLLGKGDGLFLNETGMMRRFKGALVADQSVKKSNVLKTKSGLMDNIIKALMTKNKSVKK